MAENYEDEHTGFMESMIPTVQRLVQKLSFSLAATADDVSIHTIDNMQIYGR